MTAFILLLPKQNLFLMHDYWIGDTVRVLSSGKTGKFEGEVNGNAKVKIDKKTLLVPLQDIELVDIETEYSPPIEFNDKTSIHNNIKTFSDILDLHIDKLNPKMKNEIPQMIINYQIKIAREYIKEAIVRKRNSVTLIHGKGTGALKMEINHLLDSISEVYFTKSVNDGGAVEILFSYD